MSKICIHAIVKGKVQGVYYRASTCNKAHELNLAGWVKNMPNGDVELEAYGDKENVMHLIEWLKQGPENAIVTELTWEKVNKIYLDDFQITYE